MTPPLPLDVSEELCLDLVKEIKKPSFPESNPFRLVTLCSTRSMTIAVAKQLMGRTDACKEVLNQVLVSCNAWSESTEVDSVNIEPIAIGWVNLLWELCGLKSCDDCVKCGGLSVSVAGRGLFGELIDVLVSGKRSVGANLENLLKCLKSIDIMGKDYKRDKRLAAWNDIIRGKLHHSDSKLSLTDSLLGQTLFMHCLTNLSNAYKNCSTWANHLEINIPTVKIIEGIFDRRDLAAAACTRYFDSPLDRSSIVYKLYKGEIALMAEFRSRSKLSRQELIDNIYQSKRESTEQARKIRAEAIAATIGKIVHGDSDGTTLVTSPDTKQSRISQLSCLIRESTSEGDRSSSKSRREYKAYLSSFQYRNVQVIEENSQCAPGSMQWPPQSAERRNLFSKALGARYRGGHDTDFLAKIFQKDPTDPSQGCRSVVWVLDGEIVFFHVLAVLRAIESSKRKLWVSSALADSSKPTITSSVICGQEISGVELSIANSMEMTFVANRHSSETDVHLPLFEHNECGEIVPTQRFHSLINFLQRVELNEEKKFYYYKSGHPAAKSAKRMLSGLQKRQKIDSLIAFKEGLMAVLDEPSSAILLEPSTGTNGNLEKSCRLPTFLLECFLRSGAKIPQSLFFVPITFESIDNGERAGVQTVIPGAFLAGTFAGLEWDGIPSVLNRFDYHLQTTIDAMRSAVDYEIGDVLERDSKRIKDLAISDEMKRQAGVLAAIDLPLKNLTKTIHEAQFAATRITMALDREGGGFLNPVLYGAIHELYREGKDIRNAAVLNEPWEKDHEFIQGIHGWVSVHTKWPAILLYLLRTVSASKKVFSHEEFLGSTKDLDERWGEGARFFEVFRIVTAEHAGYQIANYDHENKIWHGANAVVAQQLYGLLRLLTIDVMNWEGKIHLVQVVATLAQLYRYGSVVLGGRKIAATEGYHHLDSEGLNNLRVIIEKDPGLGDAKSPNDLRCFGQLQKSVSVAAFLKSLSIFLKQVRASADLKNRVYSVDWKVQWCTGNDAGMLIDFYCENQFDAKTKKGLIDYAVEPTTEFHDFRAAVKEISSGLGCYPSFVPALSRDSVMPSGNAPILVLEYEESGTAFCQIRLFIPAV